MRGALPRRRSALLGELEAPKFPVSAMPRHGLLRLGIGPCLGEGPLRLGEPAILFLFLSFVNFRNHHLLVRITIELKNKHEIRSIDYPNKLMKGFVLVYKLYVKCSEFRFALANLFLGRLVFLPLRQAYKL